MKKRAIMLPLIGAGVAALALLAALAAGDQEKKLTIADLPEAARATLTQLAGGAPFTEVEREHEDGAVVYEAEWMADGVEHAASVTEEGALVETEEETTVASVPAAVRAAIAAHFGADAKVEVEKTTYIAYEVEARINGKEKSVIILPTGRIHGEEEHEGRDEQDDD